MNDAHLKAKAYSCVARSHAHIHIHTHMGNTQGLFGMIALPKATQMR
jgi:hypothetical protein